MKTLSKIMNRWMVISFKCQFIILNTKSWKMNYSSKKEQVSQTSGITTAPKAIEVPYITSQGVSKQVNTWSNAWANYLNVEDARNFSLC